MIGFWCKISIELNLVEIYGKMGGKPPFMVILEDLYRYRTEWYRYSLGSRRFWLTCTGTGQSCTGTPCSILTSVHILAITCSFLIRFE